MDSLHWLLQLHLIRPWWLLALIPLALLIWTFSRMQTQNRNWTSVIDSRLLAHLLQSTHTEKKSIPAISLFAFGSLVIFALTGPAFEKRPQPVFKTQSALVIILDLSLSMNATDVKPSRLSRAHFKIVDILNQRKEGQTALIAYAANAYTVSPLTDDAYTISAQISALQTSIMPGQGSRLDIALKKARELFTNAGHSKGNIFIVSDSINKKALNIIEQLNSEGFITSMLAIGTREGAPIALKNGGFVKDRSGNIVIPKLDIRQLQQAAQTGGGRFSLLSADDRDINHLMSAIDIERNTASHNLTEEPSDKQQAKLTTDIWYEQGPWLLLLVIPFAAYTFRKGLVFVLVVFILPLPQPAQAIEWSSLWKNSDQQGEAALQKGEAEKAAGLFNDPEWKATAQYRAGQYQQAAEQLSNIDTPQANYNRGNALAKAGQLDQAIEAYNRAIELQADHEDAIYNKQLLEKAQQEKKDNKEKEKNKDDKNEDQKDKNQQNSDSSQQDDSKSENSDNKDSKSGESGSEKSGSENNSSSDNNKEENSNQASQDNKQTSTNSEKEAREKKIREKEAEEKEARERAEKNTEQENTPEDEKQRAQRAREIAEQTPDLNQQQTQQWLNKIPDDPGGLLRRKFQYQYSQDKRQEENQPW